MKPGGKSSGKGKQKKMRTPITARQLTSLLDSLVAVADRRETRIEDEDGSDANYDKTLETAQCREYSFI